MGREKQSDDIKDLERRLESWATHDISEDAQLSCDDLINRLAGIEASEKSLDMISSGRRKPWLWSSAAALTLGLLIWIAYDKTIFKESDASLVTADSITAVQTSDFTLLRSVNRVDAREDDGLIIPNDGTAPYYRYRYHVVDEEQVRDKETGAVITLRQPRQEVITVPVTQF